DEPTTALDVSVQKRIIALLRMLQREKGMGMLLVTHDFGLVAEMADEVAVMYAGEIVEQASVMEIFDHPSHPYTKALMNCRPERVNDGKELTIIPGNVPSPGKWAKGCRFAPRCTFATDACSEKVKLDAWSNGAHLARCLRVGEI
ncbi:MAG: ABC transporter ATP-binding protein, partial [Ghiorsea sp.]